MILIEGLRKSFGRHREVHAVAGVSFAAPAGEITGLLGPNGAGKTTLLRMLATLVIPDGGHATIDGRDVVRERYAVRRRIGVLSDARGLYPRLTARENIRYFGALHGLATRDLDARVDALLATLGLAAIADRRAQGKCLLFSSHVMQEVAALCDRIIILAHGSVVAQGNAAELSAAAGTPSLEDAFVRLIGSGEGLAA